LFDSYKNKIYNNNTTINREAFNNGDIKDLYINNTNWFLISYYKEQYFLYYGKDINNISSNTTCLV
jgi:hypothetical protein